MTFDDLYTKGADLSSSQNFMLGDNIVYLTVKAFGFYPSMVINALQSDSSWEELIDAREDFAGFMLLFNQAGILPETHPYYDAHQYTVPMGDKIRCIIDDICNNPQE